MQELCVRNIDLNFLRSQVQLISKVGQMNVYAFIEMVDMLASFFEFNPTRLK